MANIRGFFAFSRICLHVQAKGPALLFRVLLPSVSHILMEAMRVRLTAGNPLASRPHEEGVDYPEGHVCPQCPFWAHRDRWSGDMVQ